MVGGDRNFKLPTSPGRPPLLQRPIQFMRIQTQLYKELIHLCCDIYDTFGYLVRFLSQIDVSPYVHKEQRQYRVSFHQ